MTTRILPSAVLCVAALLCLVAAICGARAADPNALWKIVHERCVPDQEQHNTPSPCISVNTERGAATGYAILKDIVGETQFLLIPTGRIAGIESPEILADDAPNYFAAAWEARTAMEVVLHHPLPREDVSLAINSPHARTQEQLHIHIDCLRADVVSALRAEGPAIGPTWAPLAQPLLGHPYRARWLSQAELAATSPFRLLAADVGAGAMPQQTLVMAGAVSPDGQPGFVLLADHFEVASGDRAGGEELQDHDCAVAHLKETN